MSLLIECGTTRGGHGELDGRGVDDAHDVARAGRLEHAEEGPVAAILSVQLDDLLVVVGALEELDPGVERPAVSLEEDLDAVDRRVERVRAEGATLDGCGGRDAVGRGLSTTSANTLAAMGNSIWPMLRMATVLGPRGVSTTALKGRSWPFSTYTRILHGVLSGPCQSSMSASSGRPSVLRTTCTCSISGRAVRPRAERATLHEDGGVNCCSRDGTTRHVASLHTLSDGRGGLHGHGGAHGAAGEGRGPGLVA